MIISRSIHLCCCKWHYSILFNGRVIFHCMCAPQPLHPFLSMGTGHLHVFPSLISFCECLLRSSLCQASAVDAILAVQAVSDLCWIYFSEVVLLFPQFPLFFFFLAIMTGLNKPPWCLLNSISKIHADLMESPCTKTFQIKGQNF